MNRKDDHIKYALDQKPLTNDFDEIRFVPNSIPNTDVAMVDLSVKLFGKTFPYPIYINAMTGGTMKALKINEHLAMLAKHFNLMIASGSLSQAIKDPTTIPTYTILRETFKEGFIIANIGISAPLDFLDQAIQILNANAIQIHINAPQEIIMPEGDRVFHDWLDNLTHHVKHSKVPVIAKETGFGMSKETIQTLNDLNVAAIDVSGKGGTNFITIENARRSTPLKSFENYGFSTVESLIEANHVNGATILASGGIRDAYDVCKALALGASAVGLSGYFLKLVTNYPIEEAIKKVEEFLEDIKKIMAILDAKTVHDLRNKRLIYSERLLNFMHQRET